MAAMVYGEEPFIGMEKMVPYQTVILSITWQPALIVAVVVVQFTLTVTVR